MKKIVFVFAVVAAVLFFGCNKNSGSDSPIGKNLTIIVPFSPGGGTDATARALAESVKPSFNNRVMVENRTGGGGAVGMLYGANAKPNGSIVSVVTVELTTLPHIGTGGNLNPAQFKPLLIYNSDYSVITVKSDSKFSNLDEFIAAAQNTEMQIGNSGVGAIWHLAAAALAQSTNAKFKHIPFEGAAPAITSLLGGHIDAVSVSYAEVSAQVAAGNLKVLAILGPDRIAAIPDVPTARELGYDVQVGTWRGLAVPANTPDSVVQSLYEVFSNATNDERFVDFMTKNNFSITVLNSQEAAERITKDYELFGNLIASLGLAKQQ